MKTVAITVALGALLAISAEAQIGLISRLLRGQGKAGQASRFRSHRQIVAANRKNGGDNWLAFDMMYGDGGAVAFVSTRQDLASIDTANQTFMKALKDTYGDAAETMMHDFDACTTSSRGEIRRPQPRLSASDTPANDEDYAKYVGEARYIRTMTVRFKTGPCRRRGEALRNGQERRPAARSLSRDACLAGRRGRRGRHVLRLQPWTVDRLARVEDAES